MRESCLINIISPVFIGTNNFLSPYSDYFYFNNKVYYLSFENFIKNIPENKIDQYIQAYHEALASKKDIKKGSYLYDIIQQLKLEPLSFASYAVQCSVNPQNRNIRKTISTSDNVYIPGSSIKGAIRISILYHYLTNSEPGQESLEVFIRKLKTTTQLFWSKQKEVFNLESTGRSLNSYKEKYNLRRKIDTILYPLRQKINNFLKLLELDLFGGSPDTDFMKLLIVTDSSSTPKDLCICIEEIKRIRLKDKKSVGAPQIAETIKENSQFNFDIKLNALNDLIYNKDFFSSIDIKSILQMVNNFTKDQIRNELKLYKNDKAFLNIISFYNQILESNNTKYLIRLGGNKNFLFNTISSLIPENEFKIFREILRIGENPFTGNLARDRFPSTQRFISGNNLIGLVPGWCSIDLSTNH